jgi:hypothetical protein
MKSHSWSKTNLINPHPKNRRISGEKSLGLRRGEGERKKRKKKEERRRRKEKGRRGDPVPVL